MFYQYIKEVPGYDTDSILKNKRRRLFKDWYNDLLFCFKLAKQVKAVYRCLYNCITANTTIMPVNSAIIEA
jgi:hypothetical protein